MKILKKLEEAQIFSITPHSQDKLRILEKHVTFEELCDQYYNIELNKDQLGRLIEELSEIHRALLPDGEDLTLTHWTAARYCQRLKSKMIGENNE